MGRRGPQPKPTNLRLLHGDRKDRINDSEPMPGEGLPECPLDVDPEVSVVWDRTLGVLAPIGLATRADGDTLLAYCEAVVLHRKASRMLADCDPVIRGLHGGSVRHPAVQVQRDAAMVLRAFAQEFGLTPAARAQIRMPAKKEPGGAARLLSS